MDDLYLEQKRNRRRERKKREEELQLNQAQIYNKLCEKRIKHSELKQIKRKGEGEKEREKQIKESSERTEK